ncbi:hypothetical protein Z517_00239 [Fonsecaea pedrosoi CBS 271.37]|uniref:Unplaced genomic scaffold supercont1.1, whole genome shotgun sequence n=1 Tax=Fonsecaea pedrosoi CBS 271.37 TaxID=1442368 RepID=A0A0D2E438_9EURO|nr:uncharacterized protein Z517_00239 [Fonsecaea pedrosoi CBS 271.37]KIW84851.1 hypothetical protein Z517_00239 [Fonsecaea pedrosoi CBS 271.37]
MSEAGSYAFVTGGASGIGRALTIALVKEGCQVFIVDRDIHSAIDFAAELNQTAQVAWTAQVDVTNWDEQVSAFEKAVDTFGRIDYVFPIAGLSERRSFPNRGKDLKRFEKPDLSVIDVNLTAVLYTVSLALQQFRRQDVNKFGFKGKIGCVSSICGLYAPATLPMYTATKHGIVGFVRGFGKYLPREQITMNAVCPAVVRTAMTNAFSDRLEGLGLLTPMSSVVGAFQSMLGSNDVSGECFEAGPKGYKIKSPSDYSDDEMRRTMLMISEKSVSLHESVKE